MQRNKLIAFSPGSKTSGKSGKIPNIYASNVGQMKPTKKPFSRNTKMMNTQDFKYAKSGQVISSPLMQIGLSSLRQGPNEEKKKVTLDEIPQEIQNEDYDVNESEESKIIRQPWISAQKREINMASPHAYRSQNNSKYVGEYQSAILGNDHETSLITEFNRSKPPIANKRQQKIQRSASPIIDNAFLSKINSKGVSTMLQSRGQSPIANLSKNLMNDSNYTQKQNENRKSNQNKKAPNTSRLSVNTISQTSNIKSQSKYFQHTHISVGKIYQVQAGGDSSCPNRVTTQSVNDGSQFSNHQHGKHSVMLQEGTADMIIEENTSQRKQSTCNSRDMVKRVCQYVIPSNMTKTRQSRNTLQSQQPVMGLKTMAYKTNTCGMHMKQKTAGTLQNYYNSQTNFSYDQPQIKSNNHSGVETNYKNQIPKAILTLECSKVANENNQRSILKTGSNKQIKSDDQNKRAGGSVKANHVPNKSQASLGSIPSNSSMQRQFMSNQYKSGKNNVISNQSSNKKQNLGGIKKYGNQENPYSIQIQSDVRKFVNSSEIYNSIPNQGYSRGLNEIGPMHNNTSIGMGQCQQSDYLQTYNDFEMDEGDSHSHEPSAHLYSTRRPSHNKNRFRSPELQSIDEKKYQTTVNTTTQNSSLRKQPIPNMKINKSLSPKQALDKIVNRDQILVSGFQKTVISNKKPVKQNLKETTQKGIQDRLRQKYNFSKSPPNKINQEVKRNSKARSNGSGSGNSPVVDFSKTKFLTFANQIRKAIMCENVTQMNESKAMQFINDVKNQEILEKQINVHHFDIMVNRQKDKGSLIQFLCLMNKMPNLIDLLLKKKIKVTNQENNNVMKKPLVDKDIKSMKHGYSCLQIAALGLHHKLIEKLLLCKSNANHRDNKNRTALWYLVEMFQREQSFKFPNKKLISQIEDILELIAPFCEESMKMEDVDGMSPHKLAKNNNVKELLNEIFQNFQMNEVLLTKEEDINDSSSMSNTDEFNVGNVQVIKHQTMKSHGQNSNNFSKDKSEFAFTVKNSKTNISHHEQSSIAIIGVEIPPTQNQYSQQNQNQIKHAQIHLIKPNDSNRNISMNCQNTSHNNNTSRRGDSIDKSKKYQSQNYGQSYDEHQNLQYADNDQITLKSYVQQEEMKQQSVHSQQNNREIVNRQSHQQAPPQNIALPGLEEDVYANPSGGLTTHQDEERGESMQEINNKNLAETPVKDHMIINQLKKQMIDFDQNLSRSENQKNKVINISKTLEGFSRNNFGVEENITPNQLEKLQTVETPFKMKDVIKNEKFERISSYKFAERSNQTDKPKKQNNKVMKDKVIGNSFLGSSHIADSESRCQEENIGPNHFKAHQLLGTGSFGEVFLVEEIATKELYAMKVLSKEKINEQFLLKYAFAEKQIMAEMTKINHPYIVKIKYTFQTTESLFMIMQFCSGGDLSQYLELEGCFDEDKARIYICEIICAIESLHKHNIIFRDLKPDNIVLDSEGHALLTDFGLSRQGISGNMTGADSFCGSYAYLAPEMIKKCGHGKAVDWYLIGVVLFELLTGLPPFYDDNKEVLFQNILNHELEFPEDNEVTLSEDCKNLIFSLLNKDPHKRLGNIGGIREIKMHPFFEGVDWVKVQQRQSKVPPAYLSEMALEIIAKQPFMLKDHPKTQGEPCLPGHPMYIEGWEMNMTSYGLTLQQQVMLSQK